MCSLVHAQSVYKEQIKKCSAVRETVGMLPTGLWGGSRSISGLSCSVCTEVKRRHGPCSGMLQSCLRVQQANGGVFELERRQRRREQKGRNRAFPPTPAGEIAARPYRSAAVSGNGIWKSDQHICFTHHRGTMRRACVRGRASM